MKNYLLKYYIVIFNLCSIVVTFGQAAPGTNDDTGNLETADPVAAPIDDYIWVLAALGLVYIFLRLRAFSLQGKTPQK